MGSELYYNDDGPLDWQSNRKWSFVSRC